MKNLHIIHTKDIKDIKRTKGKILPVLEAATLEWAKEKQTAAYEATVALKQKLKGDPKQANKYFRFLRRLLEIRLEEAETENEKVHPKPLNYLGVPNDLFEALNIESVRIPEFISCTQLDMWNTCKLKWYWRYAKGIKTPKTAALHFGTAVDEALNFFFETVKNSGKEPPAAAVHASFHEWFTKDKDKVVWGDANQSQLYKNGPVIIDAYLEAFADKTKVFDVQTKVSIKLDNNGLIVGAIDVMEKDVVIDTKTSKGLWETEGKWAKHKSALQPKAYSLWFYEEYGKMPKEFRYQVVTKETDAKGKPKPQTQMITFQVMRHEVEAFRADAQKIWDEMLEYLPKGREAYTPACETPLSLTIKSEAVERGAYGSIETYEDEDGNPIVKGSLMEETSQSYKVRLDGGQAFEVPKDDVAREKRGRVAALCCAEWCDYSTDCESIGLRIPLRWDKQKKKHIFAEDEV